MSWNPAVDNWIVLAAALSAGSCALLGNFLLLRRMSLMGDAISHAVLPGIAAAFILTGSRSSWPMLLGAVIAGMLTALLTETIRRYGRVEHGAAMGVVFSVLFALGLVLIRRVADHVDLDPSCVLYGNINAIGLDAMLDDGIPRGVVNPAIVFVLNLIFVGLFYKELKICAFDPQLASAQGIHAGVMHYVLMIMVAMTTVANFEVTGSVLVIAMLIVPPATAYMLTDRLGIMIMLSVSVAMIAGAGGHVLAYLGPAWIGMGDVSVETAGMMTAIAGTLFAVAVILGPRHGLLSQAVTRWRLRISIVREDILGMLYRWDEVRGERGAMPRRHIVEAMGGGWLSRAALWALVLRKHVHTTSCSTGGPGPGLELTATGLSTAMHLVRSHRLWESYLAQHFTLPDDHLHDPAERVEHFLSSAMHDELDSELGGITMDPHGKTIPPAEGSDTES